MRYKVRSVLLLVLVTILPIAAAQTPVGAPSVANVREPEPEDAIRATIAAFDTFRIVVLAVQGGTKEATDFVFSLVKHPAFPNAVNDIVVEGPSSALQPLLDRYIAGEDVPIVEARRLWREGTDPRNGVSNGLAQLFQLVRRINQKLPPLQRLRVVAGEPPQYRSPEQREADIAKVIVNEVLAKNRKALMFYGAGHVHRGLSTAVDLYEQNYPQVTFIIETYVGGADRDRCGLPAAVNGTPHQSKMASWPVPSVVRTKGTWLADFAKAQIYTPRMVAAMAALGMSSSSSDPIDAYLYLGPPDLLIATQPSVFTFTDKDYLAALRSRISPSPSSLDPEKVRELDSNMLRCEPGP
jgi:hypothetical protein